MIAILLLALGAPVWTMATFSERLNVRSIHEGEESVVVAKFTFRQSFEPRQDDMNILDTFPRALHNIMTSEPDWPRIDINLVKGRWLWGQKEASTSLPIGLSVFMETKEPSTFDKRSLHCLLRRLNTLTQASTNLLIGLEGSMLTSSAPPILLAMQPKEPVCMENLGAIIRTLPCRDQVSHLRMIL